MAGFLLMSNFGDLCGREYVVPCWAKTNLGLKVLRRLDTGFHLIRTIICRISLCDRLKLTVSPGKGRVFFAQKISENCASHMEAIANADPSAYRRMNAGLSPENNLVMRAVNLFLEYSDYGEHRGLLRSLDYNLELEKNIPLGAGLGGGSGDAAGVLRLLGEVFPQVASTQSLLALASELGSDVAAMMWDQPTLVTGWGNVIAPLYGRLTMFSSSINPGNQTQTCLCLLKPPFSIPTADAYSWFSLPLGQGFPIYNDKEESINTELLDQLFLGDNEAKILGLHGQEVYAICRKNNRNLLTIFTHEGNSQRLLDLTQDQLQKRHDDCSCVNVGSVSQLKALKELTKNDFEPVVFSKYPDLALARDALLCMGADCSWLSGSGSCLVGVFSGQEAVAKVRNLLEEKRAAGWFVDFAQLL